MKNNFRKIFFENWPLLVLFFVCFIPFFWPLPGLILKGDLNVPLNPILVQKSNFYLWNPQNFGGQMSLGLINLVDVFFWSTLYFFGLKINIIQMFWMAAISIVSGFSMYYLLSVFFNSNTEKEKVAKMLGSVFYVFNLYTTILSPLTPSYAVLLMFFPLIFAFIAKGLKEQSLQYKYAIFLGFIVTLSSSALFNFPIVAIVLGFYLIFHIFMERKGLFFYTRFFLINFFIVFVLNIWLIAPIILSFFSVSQSVANEIIDINRVVGNSTHTTFLNLFQLKGSWGFYGFHQGYPYFSYAKFYFSNPFLIIFSFLPIFLAVLTLIRNKKKNINILFFGFLLIISLFLSYGFYPGRPFGFLYKFLYEHIPGFVTFRDPNKFGIITMFSLSFFLAIFSKQVFDNFQNKFSFINARRRTLIFTFILLFLILVNSWPMITGHVIQPERGLLPKEHVNFPNYWEEAAQYIDSFEENNKLFVYPVLQTYLKYTWGYHGSEFIPTFIKTPALTGVFSYFSYPKYTDMMNLLSQFYNYKKESFLRILSFFNVKNILIKKDIDYEYYEGFFRKETKILEENLKNLNLKSLDFGGLVVYNLPDEYFLPHFYVPEEIIYANGGVDIIPDITGSEDYTTRSAVFINNFDKDYEILNDEIKIKSIYLKTKVKDKINEFEINRNLGVESRNLQTPKISPHSRFYFLILFKERFDEWIVKNNPRYLFVKKVNYADKRLSEFIKFSELENLEVKSLKESYYREMLDALDIIKELKIDQTDDFYEFLTKYNNVLLGQENLIKDFERMELFKDLFLSLETKVSELNDEHDFSKIKYDVEIPFDGVYEIILIEDGEKKLGENYFYKGKQELTISYPWISENILDEEGLNFFNSGIGAIYEISFSYKSEKGGSFELKTEKGESFFGRYLASTFNDQERDYKIYFSVPYYLLDSKINLDFDLINYENLSIKRVYSPKAPFLKRKQIKAENLEKKNVPIIKFKKINPTRYVIEVQNAREPYILVFSENFNSNWNLSINSNFKKELDGIVKNYFNGEILESFSGNKFWLKEIRTGIFTKIPDERHFTVNGYANSWLINPIDSSFNGNYEIIVDFSPQKNVYINLSVSFLAFLIAFTYLIIRKINSK